MSAVGCKCGTVHGNTGLPSCVELFGKALGIGVISLKDNLNALNYITLTSNVGVQFGNMLDNENRTQRLFPITELRNVVPAVEDSQYATDNAGGRVRTRRGFKSLTYEKWEVSDVFVGKAQQGECNANGVYLFSARGIQGIKSGNVLMPIPIEAYDNKFMPADDANPSKLMGSFQYSPTVQDGDLWMITWEELNWSLEYVVGLIDVNFEITDQVEINTGTTTFSAAITTDYGINNPNLNSVEGLEIADFTLTDLTDGVDIELDDLEIDPITGIYTFSYTQTVPTTNEVEVKIFAKGYEGVFKYVQP
jgi:hypothetical protein